MGRKAGKFKRKENGGPSKKNAVEFDFVDEDMMNDEIDAFHKQRDVISLNVDKDIEEFDEDNEQPVLDFEDGNEDEVDEDDGLEDDYKPAKGLEAKMARTLKHMRAKFGGVEDETLDADDGEEGDKGIWGRKKDDYLGGDDADFDAKSSEDEDIVAEEQEVLEMQRERAKALSLYDLGIADTSEDETAREPTFEEILDKGKPREKASHDNGNKEDGGISYEIVKKDLNTLTKEEQMDVVYNSAPELVGLLSELKDALEQLENKINPFLEKINGRESMEMGGMHYLQVKQLLLQSYCQAITFYLLLKTEGHPVRDHPVVSRLVEIKTLIDKMKEIEDNLPFDFDDILKNDMSDISVMKLVKESAVLESDSLTNSQIVSRVSSEKHAIAEPNETAELKSVKISKNNETQGKSQDKQIGAQSIEMLKVRAALEEKLKQKGVFSSIAPKNVRNKENQQLVNSQLETLADFDDEAMEIDGVAHGMSSGTLYPNKRKRKVISGDDDIPKRDDIGERRRKHELRVMAGAGIKSFDDVEDDDDIGNISSDGGANIEGGTDADSDLEYYKQSEQKLNAKVAAKSNKYSRTTPALALTSLAESPIDGKRHITNQIDKNRGLTRPRKKLIKNPRKNNRLKHEKAEKRRAGQVRKVRKFEGNYGGEVTGINASISRSRRFQS